MIVYIIMMKYELLLSISNDVVLVLKKMKSREGCDKVHAFFSHKLEDEERYVTSCDDD